MCGYQVGPDDYIEVPIQERRVAVVIPAGKSYEGVLKDARAHFPNAEVWLIILWRDVDPFRDETEDMREKFRQKREDGHFFMIDYGSIWHGEKSRMLAIKIGIERLNRIFYGHEVIVVMNGGTTVQGWAAVRIFDLLRTKAQLVNLQRDGLEVLEEKKSIYT